MFNLQCLDCPKGYYSNINSTSCIKCKPGSFSDKIRLSNCTFCGKGYFSNITASIQDTCEKCREGTYSNEGSGFCSPCETNTYQQDPGKDYCSPCNSTSFCSLGSINPINNNSIQSISFDLVDNSNLIQYNDNSQFSNDFKTYFIVTGVSVIFVIFPIIFLIILILYLLLKYLRLPTFFFYDYFSLKHFVLPGKSPIKYKTSLGISFSMIAGFTILIFIVASIVQYSVSNTITTSLIIPSNQNSTKNLKFNINIKFYQFIGICSVINFQKIVGLTGNFSYSSTPYSDFCLVKFECYSCDMSGISSNIYFNITDLFAASSSFSYNMSINYIRNNTFVLQNGIFVDYGKLFKGPDPTIFQMLITSTQFQSLKSNILDIPQKSTIDYGYTFNQLSLVKGSIANSSTFNSQLGLGVLFQISLNYNSIYIEEINKTSFLNFLAQIAALISAILSIYTIILTSIENLFSKLSHFVMLLVKKLKKNQKQDPIEEDKKIEITPQSQELENIPVDINPQNGGEIQE
jgi:hypothetical protein